jgi:hypothetical protein
VAACRGAPCRGWWPISRPCGGDAAATWAVGDQGVALRHDGARWQLVTYFAGAAPVDLLGLWGVGRRLWAVGTGGTILRYDSP